MGVKKHVQLGRDKQKFKPTHVFHWRTPAHLTAQKLVATYFLQGAKKVTSASKTWPMLVPKGKKKK